MSGAVELEAELRLTETWRPVPGLEGRYDVSDHGRIRSVARLVEKRSRAGNVYLYPIQAAILSLKLDSHGYLYVGVRLDRRHIKIYAHQAVLRSFIGPCPDGAEVAHGDGIRTHNRLDNLRYATRAENHADKSIHGTMPRGMNHASARLSDKDVCVIRASNLTQKALALQFGVSQQHISKIRRGRSWSTVGVRDVADR